jgi:hypothetical protein
VGFQLPSGFADRLEAIRDLLDRFEAKGDDADLREALVKAVDLIDTLDLNELRDAIDYSLRTAGGTINLSDAALFDNFLNLERRLLECMDIDKETRARILGLIRQARELSGALLGRAEQAIEALTRLKRELSDQKSAMVRRRDVKELRRYILGGVAVLAVDAGALQVSLPAASATLSVIAGLVMSIQTAYQALQVVER